MSIDPRAILAAENNADLYEAVFEAHNLRFTRTPFAFIGLDAPPPYYANLTIQAPDQQSACRTEIETLAKTFAGRVAVKDSFCQIDLGANGFNTLFDASWIWRGPTPAQPNHWRAVETNADLALWEDAWRAHGSPTDQRMFPPQMRDRPEVSFLGYKSGGIFDAGCIANHSGNCIGISNVFSAAPLSFSAAAEAAATLDPTKPLVGYESGNALDAALACGFVATGYLRILLAEHATF